MASYLTDGIKIRHKSGTSIVYGVYCGESKTIIGDGVSYPTPSSFAMAHHNRARPGRRVSADGWLECKCEIGERWVTLDYLRKFVNTITSDDSDTEMTTEEDLLSFYQIPATTIREVHIGDFL